MNYIVSKERKIKHLNELHSIEGEENQTPLLPPAESNQCKHCHYLQATGFDPDSHILGITAFVFGLQGEWALVVILPIRVFFSILKKKTILKMTSGKHNYISI